jgi:2-polyprenyl-3-methyl-5-hydroxy-6-metoxy-1,4-benzoquinol methylase
MKNIKLINKALINKKFIEPFNSKISLNANFNKRFFTSKRASRDESKHIDEKDDEFFKTIKDWWNPEGSMRTLHHFNDLRIEYIINSLKNTLKVTQNDLKKNLPLEDFTALDVGCGGGILTEV